MRLYYLELFGLTRIQRSRSTVIHPIFTSRRLPTDTRSDYHNPHAEARPYPTQQWPDTTITSAGSSGERTDVLMYAGFPGSHSHSDGGVGDKGLLVELSPGLCTDGLPSQPTGVQRRRNTGKTKQTTDPYKAAPAQERTRRRKLGGLRDSGMAVEVSFRGMRKVTECKP